MAMVATPSPELFVLPRLRRLPRSERSPDALQEQLAAVVERSALAMLDPDAIGRRPRTWGWWSASGFITPGWRLSP